MKRIALLSTLSLSACPDDPDEPVISPLIEDKKELELKTETVKDLLTPDNEEAVDTYSGFFLFFLIVVGSFLQYIGLWEALAKHSKWLVWHSFKDIKTWFRQQEGDK